MSDRTRRWRRWAHLMLASGLAANNLQAQSYRSHRSSDEDAPTRQPADPDKAANAARAATGGRVLGVQGAEQEGRQGYQVRILEPSGRVRNFHYDPAHGRTRD